MWDRSVVKDTAAQAGTPSAGSTAVGGTSEALVGEVVAVTLATTAAPTPSEMCRPC